MSQALNIAVIDADKNLSVSPADLLPFAIQMSPVSDAPTHPPAAYDAIVINSSDPEKAASIAKSYTVKSAGSPPAILISDTSTPPSGIDGWLRPPVSAVQLANRIQALRRLWVMEDIARRRKAVSEVFGHPVSDDSTTGKRPSVLFVGDATSRFMAIRHALDAAGTGMIAAFSSFSAFDYLHERPFDAVILNAISKKDLAFTISSAMRRNARLYHTPVLLLTPQGHFDAADEAFARGVSDILPADAQPEEISARVQQLVDERRRRRSAKATLENCRARSTTDAELGLFRPKFSLAHLQDLLNTAARSGKPTGLVLMAIKTPEIPISQKRQDDARQQFASMLRHLLRAEDCPALIGPDLYAAILPHTNADGAVCVAERVSAVADCTAFDGDDPLHPFRLNINCAALEATGEETAEALVERGQRKLATSRMEAV
ncbi:MAG: GGDEF domain-containing protein [Hyphobacterium sp.]|nr:MAG: GGDEF domain-containing protein [Hyphobacterium sp.]